MKFLPPLRRLIAIGSVFAAAITGSTTAGAVDIFIVTHSTAVGTPCAGIANCLDIVVTGVSNDFAGLVSPIPDSWSFSLRYRTINGIASGNWSYTDLGPGGNDLFGTLTDASTPLSPSVLKDSTQMVVLGGGGMFAGATGTGQQTAYVNTGNGTSVDSTWLSVALAPVPEPSTPALLLAGLAAVAAVRALRTTGRGSPGSPASTCPA